MSAPAWFFRVLAGCAIILTLTVAASAYSLSYAARETAANTRYQLRHTPTYQDVEAVTFDARTGEVCFLIFDAEAERRAQCRMHGVNQLTYARMLP